MGAYLHIWCMHARLLCRKDQLPLRLLCDLRSRVGLCSCSTSLSKMGTKASQSPRGIRGNGAISKARFIVQKTSVIIPLNTIAFSPWAHSAFRSYCQFLASFPLSWVWFRFLGLIPLKSLLLKNRNKTSTLMSFT